MLTERSPSSVTPRQQVKTNVSEARLLTERSPSSVNAAVSPDTT
jgi:hypothetical protein